jgi:CubicO group peptidase (beta-lactamase class C family)
MLHLNRLPLVGFLAFLCLIRGGSEAVGLTVDDRVIVTATATIRATASTSGSTVGTQSAGMLGTVLAGPVTANSSTWWQVDFEAGVDGWTTADRLAAPYFPPPEASGGWRSLVAPNVTPTTTQLADIKSKTGLDWNKLKLAQDYSRSFTTSSTVLVIRNGYVAGEWGSRTATKIGSASKSLTGLTTMKLFDLSDAGQLSTTVGPDSFVHTYLPTSWGNADPRRKDIRIKHILGMASGLEPDDNPGQPDYLNVVLGKPVRVAPEIEWSYASIPIDLLSIAVQNIAQKPLADLFQAQIGAPIDMAPFTWPKFDVYTQACCGARVPVRDLARVGHLMLMKGRWAKGTAQQQPVVSKGRIAALTAKPAFYDQIVFYPTANSPFMVEADAPTYYGLTWWTNRTGAALGSTVPRDTFYAHGFRETLLVVVPSLDMVVVRFGSLPEVLPAFRREFMKRIMAAVIQQQVQQVVSLTLINADTDQSIAGFDPLLDGAALTLSALPTRNLNIRANTSPATVGSVRFGFDTNASFRVENSAPYAFAGDTAGDFAPWTPAVGTHTVVATPYTQSGAGGTAGTGVGVTFTVK